MTSADPRHGTLNGYSNLRCRCEACRTAWREYCNGLRDRRRARLSPLKVAPGIDHGYSGYTNHHCRCRICATAHRDQMRLQRSRARAS